MFIQRLFLKDKLVSFLRNYGAAAVRSRNESRFELSFELITKVKLATEKRSKR